MSKTIYLKTTKPKTNIFVDTETQTAELSVSTHIWVTARKEEIPVKTMSTSHINNCIACWEGRGNMRIPVNYLGGKEKWLTIFNQELFNREQ